MGRRGSGGVLGAEPSQHVLAVLDLEPSVWHVSVDFTKGVLTGTRGVVVEVEHLGRRQRLRLEGTARSKVELREKAVELARLLVARLS